MLGGQQNKGKGAGYVNTDLTSLLTGLTTSLRVLRNKSKLKMVKPKKNDVGICKTIEPEGRHKHEKEKLKPS
jgi:hypothetical protein